MATLSEHESKLLLADFDVPVPEESVVEDPEAAVAAARAIDGPVVLKLCGDQIAHKTERGLVRLGIAGDDAVRVAAEELLGAATPADGTCAVLVAPMLRGHRELIAGLQRDPQFGMTVMLGIGGIFTEALADVAFRLVPITPVDATEMIEDLQAQALLGELRGEPPVARERVAEILMGLSRAAEARPDILSVDLNPLLVVEGVPVAVDALVELA